MPTVSPFRHLPLAILAAVPALGLAAEPGHLSFTLDTKIPGNETVTVEVAWPIGDDGKPTADAQDICYYAPWWDEKTFATNPGGVFAHLAKSFTTVGIFFNDQSSDAPTSSFCPGTSKSDEVVVAAIAQTREREHLPPLIPFATGHSSGASFIYELMKAHSGIFGAIAPLSGRAPDVATIPQIPMLHVYTLGDDRIDTALAWMAKDASWSTLLTPDPLWYARDSPIWLHINTDEAMLLTVAWLRAVADLRNAHHGEIPPMSEWPVAVPADKVAATAEPAGLATAIPMRHFPNQDIADRFAGAHRSITRTTDPSGMQMVTVTPRAGYTRTVVVIIDPLRPMDMAQYDAVLVAGKGANAIAVQGGTDAALNALVAGLPAPVAVIASRSGESRLAKLPDGVTRVVLDPAATVAPGMLEVEADAGLAKCTPDQRNLLLLDHACGLLAKK
jgi:hypothetical protein